MKDENDDKFFDFEKASDEKTSSSAEIAKVSSQETKILVNPNNTSESKLESPAESEKKAMEILNKKNDEILAEMFDDDATPMEDKKKHTTENIPDYDEVPSDKELHEQSIKHTLAFILRKSNETLEDIKKYLENDATPKKIVKNFADSKQTVFQALDGKYYELNQIQCDHAQKMIMDSFKERMGFKTLNKNQKALKKDFEKLFDKERKFINPILKSLDKDQLHSLMATCLSIAFINSIADGEGKLLYASSVFQSFGRTILDTFIKRYFIYLDLDSEHLHEKKFSSQFQDNKKKVQEFRKYNTEQTENIIKYLRYLNREDINPCYDEKFIAEFEKQIPDFLKEKGKVKYKAKERDSYNPNPHVEKLREIVIKALEMRQMMKFEKQFPKEEIAAKSKRPIETIVSKKNTKKFVEKHADTAKENREDASILYYSVIGTELLEYFLEIGIIEDEGFVKSNIPVVSLKDEYHQDLIASASYLKPSLHPDSLTKDYYTTIKKSKLEFDIGIDTTIIRNSE